MVLASVNQRESLIKRRRQDMDFLQWQAIRSECERRRHRLDRMHAVIYRRNICHILSERSDPYATRSILRQSHRHEYRPIIIESQVVVHHLAAYHAHIA